MKLASPQVSYMSHLFGEEITPHHDLRVHGDPGISWHHRIQPGDHRPQAPVSHAGCELGDTVGDMGSDDQ